MSLMKRLRQLEREHGLFEGRLSDVEAEADKLAIRLVMLEREKGIFLPPPKPPQVKGGQPCSPVR